MKTTRKWMIGAGVLLMLAAGSASAADFSSWQKKMPITFTGYNPPGGATTLTNFPALVVLSTNITGFNYGDFESMTNQDLRFTAADQTTELYYEIESWNTNGASHVWLQVPSLADTNTAVWAYWGMSDVSPPPYTTNGAPWSEFFRAVWHLTRTNAADSTSNRFDCVAFGGCLPSAAGKVGSSVVFTNSGYLLAPTNGLTQNPMTLSFWVSTPTPSASMVMLMDRTTYNGAAGIEVYSASSKMVARGSGGTGLTSTGTIPANDWSHWSIVYNGTTASMFRNGVFDTSGTIEQVQTSATNMWIGRFGGGGHFYIGMLDEIQISTGIRSSNWLWACYMNQATNGAMAGSFNTYGAVQLANPDLPRIANMASPGRTDLSADVAGKLLTNGSSPATVYLYWATNDCTTNASDWTTSGSVTNLGSYADGTTFTNTLTGLASNTTYYWNHRASNPSGTVWAAKAGSPSFKTLGPPEISNGGGVTEVDAVGATLTGCLTNGTAAHIFILQGLQDGVWSVTNDLGTLGEGAFSTAVIGLEPGTTNYYTCQATNAYGSVLATPSVAFTTLTSVVNTWIGGGTTSNASEAANWSGGVPVRGNTIVLDGTTDKAMTWNAGSNGLPDTVFAWRQAESYTGTVTVQTVYGTTGFTNFTVSGDVTLAGGTWTHQANGSTEANRLSVTIGGNFLVTNATIMADGRGHPKGKGPGTPGVECGAAHGGTAAYSSSTFNRKTYGSVIAPTNLGSGGSYGDGGGAILLAVGGTTTLDPSALISANGTVGLLSAGSGGSIYLTTGWLAGSGTLRANGGTKASYGDGAGGRVAIVLTGADANFAAWTGTNTAFGEGVRGAAGTVYQKTAAGVDTLIIDNNNLVTAGQV